MKLRELLEKATPGPWVAKPHGDDGCDGIARPHNHSPGEECRFGVEYDDDGNESPRCTFNDEIVTTDGGCYGPNWNDAALIVALRNAAPLMLDVIEAARVCAEHGGGATSDVEALEAALTRLDAASGT